MNINVKILKHSIALAVSVSVLIAALVMTVFNEEKTNQVSVSYVRPENPEYLHIYTLLYEKNHSLEKLQELLSPFRLPWTLVIVLKECGGEADAMYHDGTITICYEYVNELWNAMPANTTKAGIEPIDTVVGPFMDTILHEFAHALFDYLDIPILGREEDAADQFSAHLYLQLDPAEARRLIMGTVYTYMVEVENTDPPSLEEFADEHSTSEQRRFNLLCMAYGSNPEHFKDVAIWGELPQYRMDVCVEEYELIELAYNTLITPHVDPELAEKVFKKNWLPKKTSRMLIKQDLNHLKRH
jgi:Putative metallopeptidase